MSEPLTHDFTINYPCISIPFKVGYNELLDFYTNLEPQTKQYYCDTIQKDWNVVDVGANIGMFTLLFGKLTDGLVWAIEASSQNYGFLKENVEGVFGEGKDVKGIYEVNNILLHNMFISDTSSRQEGEIHYLWTGRGSVAREKGEFDFYTLDDLLMMWETPINLIKIDIDGYDFEAVKGAVRVMQTYKPIMVIELVDEALALHGFNKQNVIDFMTSQGYYQERILDNCNYVFKKD